MTQFAHYPSLKNKVVLVTGGGSGIGAAHVREFTGQGARVAFFDLDDGASADLVRSLEEAGRHPPLFLKVDLRDIGALKRAIQVVAGELGDIDILINNAANDQRHTLDEVTEEFFDERIAVNLRHFVFAAQAVAPAMKARKNGVIVNTGSMSWRAGFGGMPLYTTSKAAIEGLNRALARDLGPYNIRVNCIIPGWVMTDRQLALWVDDAARARIREMQCLPGFVEPTDIARMATFLASDDSRMCTNQTFVVDGGWT